MNQDERIKFIEPPKDFFLNLLKRSSWEDLAIDAQVSLRTLRSWRSAETSIPSDIARKWSETYKIALPVHETLLLSQKRKEAGVLGGNARFEKSGNIGTAEGRSLGGKHSIEVHRKNKSSPFVPKDVFKPEHSVEFAELIGVILGDGTITPYQFIIYSNSLLEGEYAKFLARLIEKVFNASPVIIYHPTVNVIRTISSRTKAVQYLVEDGLELGNKVKHQVDVPVWIKENLEYAKACVRGLIDTDGCVYLDRHKVKGKEYSSQCIVFTSASTPLLDFVEEVWKKLNFSPTRFGKDVRLRRKEDVLEYANQVGFSNTKHAQKIRV